MNFDHEGINRIPCFVLFSIGDIFRQIFASFSRHNKVLAFLSWLRSLSTVFVQFFIEQFSFPEKICLCLSATRKNSLQNLVDQLLWLDFRLWSRAPVTPLDDVNRASILWWYTPLDQSKREFYTVHCITILSIHLNLGGLRESGPWFLLASYDQTQSNKKIA